MLEKEKPEQSIYDKTPLRVEKGPACKLSTPFLKSLPTFALVLTPFCQLQDMESVVSTEIKACSCVEHKIMLDNLVFYTCVYCTAVNIRKPRFDHCEKNQIGKKKDHQGCNFMVQRSIMSFCMPSSCGWRGSLVGISNHTKHLATLLLLGCT